MLFVEAVLIVLLAVRLAESSIKNVANNDLI